MQLIVTYRNDHLTINLFDISHSYFDYRIINVDDITQREILNLYYLYNNYFAFYMCFENYFILKKYFSNVFLFVYNEIS